MSSLQFKPVVMERYHLAEDRDNYPNHFFSRFYFDGELEIDIARSAMKRACARHQMIQARLSKNGSTWQTDRSRTVSIEEIEEWPPPYSPIDLQNEPGGRVFFRTVDGGTYIQSQTHHALMDGLGGLTLLGDWLVEYAREYTGHDIGNLPVLDQTMLKGRGRIGIFNKDAILKSPFQLVALFGAAKFMLRQVAELSPIRTPQQNESDIASVPNLISEVFSRNSTAKLKARAKRSSISLNELVISEWFLALNKWRRAEGLHEQQDWYRAIIPLNIRSKKDWQLPACNRVSMVQLDRREKDFQDLNQLARGIQYELAQIRKLGLDKTFLVAIKLFNWIPGLLNRIVKRDVCRATTVVSSLGNPFKQHRLPETDGKLNAGNLLLDRFELAVPTRPRTGVALSTSRYARHLQLTLNYDQRMLDNEQARSLWELFIDQLADGRT